MQEKNKKQKTKKPETLIERYRAIQAIGTEVEVPFNVYRCFKETGYNPCIMGTEICLGEDFVSLDTARQAISWYVHQLGGTVKWD